MINQIQPNYMSGPLQQDPGFMESRLFQNSLKRDFKIANHFCTFSPIYSFFYVKVKV